LLPSTNLIRMAESKVRVRVSLEAKDVEAKLNRVKGKFKDFGSTASAAAAAASAAVTAAFVAMGVATVRAAANVESLEVSLRSLVGGTEEAKNVMAQLNEFTAATPFQLENVVNAFRQLVASGSSVEGAIQQLGFLGDIAAVAGSEINEIAAIFAKVNAKGKVELENLNQLAERGIPVFKALAEATGLPADKLGAGAVSVEVFNAALQQFAETGGMADNAMANLSETLDGKLSTASDNLNLALAEIGEAFLPIAKFAANAAIEMAKFFQENPKAAKLAAILGTVTVAVGTLTTAFFMWTAAAAAFAIANNGATLSVQALTKAMWANPLFAIASVIIMGITAIAGAMSLFGEEAEGAAEGVDAVTDAMDSQREKGKQIERDAKFLASQYKAAAGNAKEQERIVKELIALHSVFGGVLDAENHSLDQILLGLEKLPAELAKDVEIAGIRKALDQIDEEMGTARERIETYRAAFDESMEGTGFSISDFIDTDDPDNIKAINNTGKALTLQQQEYVDATIRHMQYLRTEQAAHNEKVARLDELLAERRAGVQAKMEAEMLLANEEFLEERRKDNLKGEERELQRVKDAFQERIDETVKQFGEESDLVTQLEDAKEAELEAVREKWAMKRQDEDVKERRRLEDEAKKRADIERKWTNKRRLEGMDGRAAELEQRRQAFEDELAYAREHNLSTTALLTNYRKDRQEINDKWDAKESQSNEALLREIELAKLSATDREAARMAQEYADIDEWLRTKLELYKDNEEMQTLIQTEAQRRRDAVMTDAQLRAVKLAEDITRTLESGLEQMAGAFGEAIGDAMSGEDVDFGNTMLKMLGETLMQLGQIAIAYGITMKSIQDLMIDPLLAVAAGVAAVALGKMAVNSAESAMNGDASAGGTGMTIPAFAEGGAVLGPTLALVGEKPGSRGEAIIPFEKMGEFANMMGFGNQGATNVVVTGKIKGADISLSNQRGGRQRSRRS